MGVNREMNDVRVIDACVENGWVLTLRGVRRQPFSRWVRMAYHVLMSTDLEIGKPYLVHPQQGAWRDLELAWERETGAEAAAISFRSDMTAASAAFRQGAAAMKESAEHFVQHVKTRLTID